MNIVERLSDWMYWYLQCWGEWPARVYVGRQVLMAIHMEIAQRSSGYARARDGVLVERGSWCLWFMDCEVVTGNVWNNDITFDTPSIGFPKARRK